MTGFTRQPLAPLLEGESLCCKTCGATAFRVDQIWRDINGELNRVSMRHCDWRTPTFLDIPSYFFKDKLRQAPRASFKGFEELRPEGFGHVRRLAPGFWQPPPGHWMSSDKEVRALPFLVCRDCHDDSQYCNDSCTIDAVRRGVVALDRLNLTKLFVDRKDWRMLNIIQQEQLWKSVEHHTS